MGAIQSSINKALGTAAALKTASTLKESEKPITSNGQPKQSLTGEQKQTIKQWDIMIDAMKAESLRIQAQNRAKFLAKKKKQQMSEFNTRREMYGQDTNIGNTRHN